MESAPDQRINTDRKLPPNWFTPTFQAASVVLGLAVASLGFDLTLLMNKKFAPVGWQKRVFGLALLALLVSFGFGV
jgi:hypothetical protein